MLLEQGISLPLAPLFGQGFRDIMAPAVDEFERLLLSRTIKHNGNPVMTWCAANAVIVSDQPETEKSPRKKPSDASTASSPPS